MKDPEQYKRQIEGMNQAANFHNLETYILLFQTDGEEGNPLPRNVASFNNIKPMLGIELLLHGLFDLIGQDVERNVDTPKYGKIMNAFINDIKGAMGKTNKKLDSLREKNPNDNEA